MSTETVRNLGTLDVHEAEARKVAYKHLEEEGLKRINRDHVYADEEILDIGGSFARKLPFSVCGVRFNMTSMITMGEEKDQEELRSIDVRVGSLMGGNRLHNLHYVYKNGDLLKRVVAGINILEVGTESFRTGFEAVGSQEAQSLTDVIKDPNIDTLRSYRGNIQSNEPLRPLASIARIISLREKINGARP